MQFLNNNRSRARSRRAGYVHAVLNLVLPLGILLFVRARLPYLAVALVLLSKWRVFAVQPRYWLANIRSNSVDTIVGISFVTLVHSTPSLWPQVLFALLFVVWLIFIKPRSDSFWVGMQALFAQTIGLIALQDYVANRGQQVWPELIVIILTFVIALSCARQFLSSYEDRYLSALSFAWATFISELVWLLDHWIFFYSRYISQTAVLGTVFSYAVMRLYDKSHKETLTHKEVRTMAIFSCVILLVVVLFSSWRRSLY